MRHAWAVAGAIVLLAAGIPVAAALSIYVPVSEVAEGAPIAVEARVLAVASGYDPETGALATYVTLEVERTHRGPSGMTRIVLRERGGRIGDLVHETDAVPVYVPGTSVFAFVERGPDGAPRTAFGFFGMLTIDRGDARGRDRATRDLSGQGTILGLPGPAEIESYRLRDLAATAARAKRTASLSVEGSLFPPELPRLLWDVEPNPPPLSGPSPSAGTLDRADGPVARPPAFAPLDPGARVRWTAADSGQPVVVNVEPARNPLGNDALAVLQIERAMAAWTGVPESRLSIFLGSGSYAFTGSGSQSPARSYPPTNIVLFGDPYGDVADPSGCSGTLAIGGYWRSGSITSSVNNASFYPALRLYVIFNNNFECFLGNAENLAEVATHELGHGLGFGHSSVADAVMRSFAYGGSRGPRLGDDDRDGAHCHYPHTLTLTAPNGGETWPAGATRTIAWTSTAESGPDAGTVDLEWSSNGGSPWTTIVSATPNDGAHPWTVPNVPGSQHRVRVIRPNRVAPTPSPYPSACSSDTSDGSFQITAAPPVAGQVPSGGATPLRVDRGAAGAVFLSWGPSCSSGASDYAVYEGSLAALRAMTWDHAPAVCSAGADLTETLVPGAGSRYFLVAPRAGTLEGLLGASSWGPRPASSSACAPREATSCP